MDNFRREVLKIDKSRKHKIKNSLGTIDAYNWINTNNKWSNIGQRLNIHQFCILTRKINNLLANNLINGLDIKLPHRMGSLELRKCINKIDYDNGKVKENLPIDWDRTLKLWEEDKDAYNDKVLIKQEDLNVYRVIYKKTKCYYNNISFIKFSLNRHIKTSLKKQIKDNRIDAFKMI